MIILHLTGGMGNQMFQYAAAKTTAKRLGTDLLLDLGWYDANYEGDRPFALDCFRPPEKIAGFKDIMRLFPGYAVYDYAHKKPFSKSWLEKFLRRAASSFTVRTGLFPMKNFLFSEHNETLLAPIPFSRVHYQKAPYYTSDFVNIPDDTYMVGLWESNKFWNNMGKEIPLFFQFEDSLCEHVLLNKIRETESVSIHVRRGDKVAEEPWHLASGIDYIKSAVRIIETKTVPTFFIFSDDINWSKKYLPSILRNIQYYFVENNSAAKDLFLITQCKHNIVAPSTFSWWGAWLNANPNKCTIAPHKSLWGEMAKDYHDLIPEEWISLK